MRGSFPHDKAKAARAAMRGGPMADLRSAPRSASRGHATDGGRDWRRLSLLANIVMGAYLLYHYKGRVDEERIKQLVRSTERDVEAVNEYLGETIKVLHKLRESAALGGKAGAAIAALDSATSYANNPRRGGGGKQQPSAALPAAAPGRVGGEKIWLTIGIPSVPRLRHVDYLTETIESLLSELPDDHTDPLYGRVKVIVMNNKPGEHIVFQDLKDKLRRMRTSSALGRKADLYVEFVDNPGSLGDPRPDLPPVDDLNNPTSRPGAEVRKQTANLITLMKMAEPLSHYYLFMEDDFHVCPHAIRLLNYATRKINVISKQWLALRVSYGMNGILMRNSDLRSLYNYLWNHIIRLPPDLLWREWYGGEAEAAQAVRKRKLHVYKYNLMHHIGAVSSFAVRPDRDRWPGCFESMANVWSLATSEEFDRRRCPGNDISPCPLTDPGLEEWTANNLEFGRDL